jgi:hypothetical protein
MTASDSRSADARCKGVLLGGTLFAALALVLYFCSPSDLGRIDFAEYWAAMQVAWHGGNPYDPGALWRLQEPVLREQVQSPIRMWNPPLIVPFIFWLGRCSFDVARSVWLALSVSALALMVVNWKAIFAPSGTEAKRFILFAATWYPAALCLSYGQSSWLFAVMISMFLLRVWRGEEEERSQWWFGVVLGVVMIKPHLFGLWITVLAVDLFKSRRWRAPVGLVVVIVMSGLIAEIAFPGIWGWYLDATRQPPLMFMTPTLGSFLQSTFDCTPGIWRFGPFFVGVLACAVWRWKSPRTPVLYGRVAASELALLLPASFLISPYGWVYDHVALLPTVAILLAQRSTGWLPWALALVNVPLLLTPPWWGQQTAVWYPAAIFLAGLRIHGTILSKRINAVPASYSPDTGSR